MKKIKILAVCPNLTDPTSYYRAAGVFKDLMDRHPIEFTFYEECQLQHKGQLVFSWAKGVQFDMVYFQRCMGKEPLAMAEYFRLMKIPIWYDIDDCVWEIPDNYQIKANFSPQVLETIDKMIKLSSLVTTSTHALSNYITERLGVKCHTINNGWDLKRFPLTNQFNKDGINVWRGSSTHIDDIRTFRDELKGYEPVTFIGYDPLRQPPHLSMKGKSIAGLDIFYYFDWLKKSNIKSVLVPLKENLFNYCKSNIAWLEATYAGAVVFSNGHGEFENKGLRFNSGANDNELNAEYKYSCLLLNQYYNLENLNDARFELIERTLNQ